MAEKGDIRRALGNAVFKIPLLPGSMKLNIAKRIYSPEDTKNLEETADTLGSLYQDQREMFEAIQKACPTYAAWTTPERLEKVEGGKLIVSASALVMADYMGPTGIEAFWQKYITSDEMNESFIHWWIWLAHQAKGWGFFKDADTVEETTNILDDQELLNLRTRVQHELTRFVQQKTTTLMDYDLLFVEVNQYLKKAA